MEALQRGAAITGGALGLGRVPSASAAGPQRSPVAGMNIVMSSAIRNARSSTSAELLSL